jgi:hypothetical protein
MSARFKAGQRVRIVRVDDIPYGQKYSYLEAMMDKTGIVQDSEASLYVVRLDGDGSLVSLTEGCLIIDDSDEGLIDASD